MQKTNHGLVALDGDTALRTVLIASGGQLGLTAFLFFAFATLFLAQHTILG
jgi:hypothetical protein